MKPRRVRTVAVVLLAVAFAITTFTGTAVAHGGDNGYHHHDGWMGTHGDWGGFGFLWMAMWGLVLIGIPAILLYAYANRGAVDGGTDDDALSVLRSRYARGEIDDEEFETRRKQLLRTNEA